MVSRCYSYKIKIKGVRALYNSFDYIIIVLAFSMVAIVGYKSRTKNASSNNSGYENKKNRLDSRAD